MFAAVWRFFKVLLISAIAVLLVAFSVVNRDALTINLFPLPYTADMPAFLFALICFALGIITAGLLMSIRLSRSNRKLAKEHKRVVALQNELKTIETERLPAPVQSKA